MSYRIGKVRGENFGPYAKLEYDMSHDGLTAIEGVMVGYDGCTSNGAGKSFVIEPPVWVIYDRCLRPKLAANDVSRLLYDDAGEVICNAKGVAKIPPGGTWIEVNLVPMAPGLPTVQATQYRNHPIHGNTLELVVAGERVTRGRNEDTRAQLIRIVGMDYDTFRNTVAFAARDDVKSFYLLAEGERKSILESLLGVSIYARAFDYTAKLTKEVRATLEPKSHTRIRLQAVVEEQESNLTETTENDIEQLFHAWATVAWEHTVFVRGSNATQLESSLATRAYKDAREAVTLATNEHALLCRNATLKLRTATTAASAANREHGIAESRMLDAEERVTNVEDIANTPCITCGQKLDAAHVKRTVAALTATVEAATAAEATAFSALEAALAATKEAQKELDSIPAPVLPNTEKEYARMRAAESVLDKFESVSETLRADARQRHRQYHSAMKLAASHAAGIESSRKKLAEVESQIADIESELEDLRVCSEMFGNSGLKSFLIEMTLPHINQVASRYARRLCGAGATVALSAVSMLKSGDTREKLEVTARIPGCANSYAKASQGQKRRLDLSLLLAFREVAEQKSSGKLSQCFVDELFDGLDGAGCGVVVEILREVSDACPVIYLTHDERLKSEADRVWVATHVDGVSTLDVGTAQATPKKKAAKKVAKKKVVRRAAHSV